MRRIAACLVVVCLVLVAVPGHANWTFWMCETADPSVYGIDGRIYEADGCTLVKTGALVQFIVALDGSEIVDPLEHFDYDMSGSLGFGTNEYSDMIDWLSSGADPADISGGMNVLATAPTWDGTTTLSAPGHFIVDPVDLTGNTYSIIPGDTFDKIAYRVWNLTPTQLTTFNVPWGTEVWYLTGRELTSHNNQGGGPDDGWWIGMPGFEGGGAPAPDDWAGFNSLIGWEVLSGTRDLYALDTFLGYIVPEPGLLGLAGAAAVLGLLRRRR